METRPRTRKRLSERIPESLSVLAFLVAGDSPSLAACFFSIWGRVSGTEFKIELKSFVWRPSEQIDFFANVSASPERLHLYRSSSSSACGNENFGFSHTFVLNLFFVEVSRGFLVRKTSLTFNTSTGSEKTVRSMSNNLFCFLHLPTKSTSSASLCFLIFSFLRKRERGCLWT